jgi:putative FmdB family regulatory protein
MPIYEYRCEQGHTFEVMQSISDDPLSSCQTCKAPVKKVFHPVAVHFKGSGFYNTDYGTRRRAREGAGDEGSVGGESKADAKGADAKPADTKSEKPAGAAAKAAD